METVKQAGARRRKLVRQVPPDGSHHRGIARTAALLEAIALADQPLPLAAISARLDMPKGTAHRLVQALVRENLLARDPGGKSYTPGPRLTAIALGALANSNARAERHAIMQTLVDEIGETCNFTALDGAELVYLDRVEAAWPLRIHLQVGSRVPLHCTASGKLFLSLMAARERRRLISALPLTRYTANTMASVGSLETALRKIRQERIGTDNEEFLAGMVAVAVPVFDNLDHMCATIAVHGPTARLTLGKALSHVPKLRAAAKQLSELMFRGKPERARGRK